MSLAVPHAEYRTLSLAVPHAEYRTLSLAALTDLVVDNGIFGDGGAAIRPSRTRPPLGIVRLTR